MLRVLDWNVPGDGMGIRAIVEAIDEDEVRDTPLKSHIISTVLAQLIEAVDIIGWEVQSEEVHAAALFENLATALAILKAKLGDIEDDAEKRVRTQRQTGRNSPVRDEGHSPGQCP